MRKSSGEASFNSNELNKILPSYLLNEVKEDNATNIDNGKTTINNYFDEKVS